MKKLVALLLVLALAVGIFAACGEKKDEDGKFKVAIVLSEYNDWNKNYEKVIKEKCDEWGWEYTIFDAKQDTNTQIDHVRSIITQGYDALTIQACDNAALAPVVGEAADAVYGGLSNLLSKEWKIGDFIERYSFLMPYKALKNSELVLQPYMEYEKEGYIPTWSEWLPVPPPQLEVNIGMNKIVTTVRIQFVVTINVNVPIRVTVPETRDVRELLSIMSMLSISFVKRDIISPVGLESK